MVYTNYSDSILSGESQIFGSKYLDLVVGYSDARIQTKYMPITEMYSKDDNRSSFEFGEGSSFFMYSSKYLEDSQEGSQELMLKQKMEQIKKKKQNQRSGTKKKIVAKSPDYTHSPK